ncbi:hypothetical protein C7U89_28760 [Bradyrhizobium sp. WBOS4]|nr:hypothetical protein [Bradyrhizobium sp. WBOS8]MDD1586893.1 hypothetical protein [Bradyrhizobium sp. WBOS4]UUO46020.1 hypothetical protein DCM78_03155 [Bradyrhizobium sp. WBOS04]UUO59724.1 hypothetical protein DCM80_11385 [Bradyrhizobium sp. WBOS08]
MGDRGLFVRRTARVPDKQQRTAKEALRTRRRDLRPLSPRHCEEPLRRSNPDCLHGGILDCFATLAMTWRECGPALQETLRVDVDFELLIA